MDIGLLLCMCIINQNSHHYVKLFITDTELWYLFANHGKVKL